MPRQSTFSLPLVRAKQLREIADLHSMTVGELLNRFIVTEWENLRLGHFGPAGFWIQGGHIEGGGRRREQWFVEFKVPDFPWMCPDLTKARELLRAFEMAINGGERTQVILGKFQLDVVRQGKGIVLSAAIIDRGERWKTHMNLEIAREVSELLRAEIEKVAPSTE